MDRNRFVLPVLVILLVIVAACAPPPEDNNTGLRLVGEATLPPDSTSAELPTRVLSPTPLQRGITPERVSPLEQVTVDSAFVLVTPTLPPSKTPTSTPTHTPTPTLTRTPTVTVTTTATAFLFPTSEIVPVTRVVVQPIAEVCDSTWFFIEPRPASCPLNPPVASQAVYQQFENGYMIWVNSQDAIYILYNDPAQPRWQVVRDNFNEGMEEVSGEYLNAPRANVWQPRRGFGLLWRSNQAIRDRIGWAVQEWEQPYSAQVQIADDGTIFVNDPGATLFSLTPGGVSWQRFPASRF